MLFNVVNIQTSFWSGNAKRPKGVCVEYQIIAKFWQDGLEAIPIVNFDSFDFLTFRQAGIIL